ncbi:hypothetical protein [Pedobacter cryoconitis]|uniref:Uncharacterized protein n=1 Tax=Pedobacter cryoconitis TaxID=188932 RepID=A0A327SU77_9SPHI|nr:hypothetical protein [Pedobacter cryoconitis]RAJ32876.1 hypothetical protein LY11_01564 [Pedobacter cryoconitis]
MAIFDGRFLKGILGDFIFKVIDGVQVVSKRPVPGTMKQSVETKKASENFRKSSMLGKHIRGIFHNTLGGMNNIFLILKSAQIRFDDFVFFHCMCYYAL